MCNDNGRAFRIYKTVHETDDNLQELRPHPDSWLDGKLDNYGNVVWLIYIDDLVLFASTLKSKIILSMDSGNTEENFPEIEIYNGFRE